MLGPIVTTASATSSDTSPRTTTTASAQSAARVGAIVQASTARLTAKQARATVLKLAPKAPVIAVRASQHGGYQGFTVKIERTDGSTLIGYVDSASGVVFDWTQPTAPAAQHSSSQSSAGNQANDDDSDEDQYEDDEAGDSDDSSHDDD